jgi:hypothetical protein
MPNGERALTVARWSGNGPEVPRQARTSYTLPAQRQHYAIGRAARLIQSLSIQCPTGYRGGHLGVTHLEVTHLGANGVHACACLHDFQSRHQVTSIQLWGASRGT